MDRMTTVSTSTSIEQRLGVKLQGLVMVISGLMLSGLAVFGIAQSLPVPQSSLPAVVRSGIFRVVAMDGSSSTIPDQYFLETPDEQLQLLIPESILVPENAMSVVVTGVLENSQMEVTNIRTQPVLPPTQPIVRKTTGHVSTLSTSTVLGTYRALVVLGYYPGQSVPTSPTKADVEEVFFGDAPSVADFYHDNSFGQATITGQVTDWIPLSGSESSNIWTSISMATQAAKVADPSLDLTQFQHIILVSPYVATNLADGYALVGPTTISSPDGALRVGTEMLRSTVVNLPRSVPILPYTAIHEFGHGFGLGHAGLLGCDIAPIDTSCRIQEYADRFDVMGGAYDLPGAENLNAIHLEKLGWLTSSTMSTVQLSQGGDFVLTPLEQRNTDLKVLKIPRGQNDFLYVEYRQPLGYDAVLTDAAVFSGALLHVLNVGSYPNSYSSGADAILIDPSPPAGYSDNTLLEGPVFTDPATNMTITVMSHSASELHLHITPGTLPPSLPVISMSAPVQNGIYSKTVSFAASATSNAGIEKVEFFLQGSQTPFATDTTEPYSATLNATGYADNATIYAYVLATGNDGGRASTAPIPFIVTDHLPPIVPTISMPLPSYHQSYTSPVTFTANASSPVGIEKVEFFLAGAATPFAMDTTAPYQATYDAGDIPSGTVLRGYVLATGNDGGRASTAPIPFTVITSGSSDAAPPFISISRPLEQGIATYTLQIQASITDDHGVLRARYYFDCPDSQPVSSCSAVSVAAPYTLTRFFTVGPHTLRVVAEDYAGHTTESEVRHFTIDGGAPSITPLAWTTTNFTNTAPAQTAVTTASDDYGVDRVLFFLDTTLISTDTVAPYQTPISFAGLSTGLHYWRALAYDRAGLSNMSSLQFFRIYEAGPTQTYYPPPTLATYGFTIGTVARGRSALVALSASNSNPIASVEFYIDNRLTVKKLAAPFTMAIDSLALRNGVHRFKAVIHQRYTTETVREFSFTATNTVAVSLSRPKARATIRGNVTLAPTVLGGYGVNTIEYILDGKRRLALKKSTPRSFVWNTKNVTRGWHTMKIRVMDVRGYVASTSVRWYVVR